MHTTHAPLLSSEEVMRMTSSELQQHIFNMLEEGWKHPDPYKRIPASKTLLLRYYEALWWPSKPAKKEPQQTPPTEGVFGHTEFYIEKDTAGMTWRISVQAKDDPNRRMPVCQVQWRHAYDPSGLLALTNAGDFMNALDACLSLSPLTLEEDRKVHRMFPALPANAVAPRDATLWGTVDNKKAKTTLRAPKRELKSVGTKHKDELSLKRKVMLD